MLDWLANWSRDSEFSMEQVQAGSDFIKRELSRPRQRRQRKPGGTESFVAWRSDRSKAKHYDTCVSNIGHTEILTDQHKTSTCNS